MLDFLKKKNKVATKEDILKKLLMTDDTIPHELVLNMKLMMMEVLMYYLKLLMSI
jgi:hypothetical protein